MNYFHFSDLEEMLSKFEINDLYMLRSAPEAEYHRRKGERKTNVHWGQRKLAIMLIQFLTDWLDPDSEIDLVYVGAASGVNIGYVAQLFPKVTWHLYDPEPILTYDFPQIKKYQQFFTDADALYWSNVPNVYFVSDIRNVVKDHPYGEEEDESYNRETEEKVWEDMLAQERWFNIMKPVRASLKFRLPWPGVSGKTKVTYLCGLLYKGIWAPQTSTELRLVPTGGTCEWDLKSWESKSFHFNTEIREKKQFEPLIPVIDDELTYDFDSLAEVMVLARYLSKFVYKSENVSIDSIRSLSEQLTSFLPAEISIGDLRQNPMLIKERFELRAKAKEKAFGSRRK